MFKNRVAGITRICAIVFSALTAIAVAPAAQAEFCASGSSCGFDLTNTNVTGVNITIHVQIDNTVGGASTLTVSFVSDNITNTPLGIDQFGYGTAVLASILPAGWSQANCSTNPAPCNMNGFGDFISEIDSPGGNDLLFAFTLASQETNYDGFAAHIRYSGGCSGFVSTRTTNPNPNTGCIPGGQVPEPGTLLLLGMGLLSLGLARRRRP